MGGMRFRLRTLLMAVAVLPPLIGALWPAGMTIYRNLWPEPVVVEVEPLEIITLPLKMYVQPDGSVGETPTPEDVRNP